MRRLALLLSLSVLVATSALAVGAIKVVPADDPDVTAGWAAYRSDDHAKAIEYYRKAAARDQRVAQFNLAVMLLAGEGGPADPVQGVQWLRKSADLGFAPGQYALALLYERGEHLKRSLADATAWYQRAASL